VTTKDVEERGWTLIPGVYVEPAERSHDGEIDLETAAAEVSEWLARNSQLSERLAEALETLS
jgi:hypothetical protein